MKQIHKAIQALERDIGFWRPSWFLLKKLKNAEKIVQGKFPRANIHTTNILEIIRVGVYGYITKF